MRAQSYLFPIKEKSIHSEMERIMMNYFIISKNFFYQMSLQNVIWTHYFKM